MLSILTNFGCHWGCSYCVYRENGINIPYTKFSTFDWEALDRELSQRRGEIVSLSGGGDPLYNLNVKFLGTLLLYLEKYGCKLELHTSIVDPNFDYSDCERVVFHFTMPNQIRMLTGLANAYKGGLYLPEHVRAVFVVQEHYSKALIKEIVKEVQMSNWITELSFRQMIDKNGQPTCYLHDYLKEGHMKNWYYIEQRDYNEYFVNDHIETEYLNIGRDKP